MDQDKIKLLERVADLEIYISQIERNLEELSAVVLKQWLIIEKQGNSMNLLASRLLKLEENNAESVPIDIPPHW